MMRLVLIFFPTLFTINIISVELHNQIMSSTYPQMEEQLKIIKEFIRDKVQKTGSEGIILGLSGGLDSAVVLKLCIESLPKSSIHCLIMPEETTPQVDMEDAKSLADDWGVTWDEIRIDDMVNSFPLSRDGKLAEGNLKARIRMCLEYYFANLENKLVVGTGNKSELLLGYTTKYGDSASDFLPIGDIYKTDLRSFAAYIGVPDKIIQKTPRAGLWEGQTDEGELGYSYQELDGVLKGLESLASVEEIAARTGMQVKHVEDISERVFRNAHKRKFPPVLKLRSRTIGVDWREFSD